MTSRTRAVVSLTALALLVFVVGVSAAPPAGGPGHDTLRGSARADKLYGKGGNDKLFGLGGNDLLVGGPGHDVLTGGPGADRLSCGPGRDKARADREDAVAKDCESVTGISKPPPPAPPPPSPPLPGQKIDVGGYSLYLECEGSGSPTVLLEAGHSVPSASIHLAPIEGPKRGWRELRTALAAETRVCVYDRAGLGTSDRRPSSVRGTGAAYVNEFRTLMTKAGVPGPYILYGASYGGVLISLLTLFYPDDVAGLVFSDAIGPASFSLTNAGTSEVDFRPEFDALLRLRFDSRPLLVLSTTLSFDAPDILQRSSNKLWATAPGKGHNLAAEAPELNLAAVRLVIAAVRAGGKLPRCEETSLPSLGGRCESAG